MLLFAAWVLTVFTWFCLFVPLKRALLLRRSYLVPADRCWGIPEPTMFLMHLPSPTNQLCVDFLVIDLFWLVNLFGKIKTSGYVMESPPFYCWLFLVLLNLDCWCAMFRFRVGCTAGGRLRQRECGKQRSMFWEGSSHVAVGIGPFEIAVKIIQLM